jgi:hypothetical protein
MTAERHCAGMTDEGPCNAPPGFVREDGYCLRHSPDPEAKALAMAASIRGGVTTRAKHKPGLDPDELPPLDSPAAAEAWCEQIGRAVATGRLPASQAQAAMRAVSEWRAAHEAGALRERLEELERRVRVRAIR